DNGSLECVADGDGVDRRCDGQGADSSCGRDPIGGVEVVVAADDRLEIGAGSERPGDTADAGADLGVADRHAHFISQIPTDLGGEIADRVDAACGRRVKAPVQAAQNATVGARPAVDNVSDDEIELLIVQQPGRTLVVLDIGDLPR